jgi:hypothetical protein
VKLNLCKFRQIEGKNGRKNKKMKIILEKMQKNFAKKSNN